MLVTKSKVALLDPINAARPSTFMQLAIRLEEEHEKLKAKCSILCELSIRTASSSGRYGTLQMLKNLRQHAEAMLLDLEHHSKWEDEELFPVFSRYFRKSTEPTILPSLWVLEKDHELALQFFESFLQVSRTLIAVMQIDKDCSDLRLKEKLKEGCNQLTQGCFILSGHFQMEEELIFPLANQILTDIDYLFS
ncbi:hemerythrin domain-containing protein [Paenibacillus sp. GSMTC-2017]|uniref:hemerythrin domain-containing protein n=1 Tax=Paenibacillus sp. GSMTC-2017 TaxID=2794350 RepID=UPI0018D7C57A|nr:hemerythrin domain-containing protein [Paenibacillus sp. GSMTC-2017]MBH5317579.1 hemerythrin domain-containing protein [Paenibacillus sp. GSMTC-2017]